MNTMILSARYHKIQKYQKIEIKKEQNAWWSLDSNAEHVRESWSGKHCAKNNVGKAISPRTTVFLAAKLDANIRSKSLTNHKQKYILLRKRTWQNTVCKTGHSWPGARWRTIILVACLVKNCYLGGLLGGELLSWWPAWWRTVILVACLVEKQNAEKQKTFSLALQYPH